MNLIPNRKRTYRTTFAKLAFGESYHLASSENVAPLIKVGRRSRDNGFDNTTGRITLATISDTTVAVITRPDFLAIRGG